MNDINDKQVETEPRPNCPVCNKEGFFVYHNLKDKLFNKSGNWNMRKCKDVNCYTFWLDPTPKEKDLYKLYDNYSTHEDSVSAYHFKKYTSILDKIRNSFIYIKYGYGIKPKNFIDKTIGLIAYIHPAWRDTQEANLFYLPYKERGFLLDVGCGSGGAMKTMQNLGWQTMGVDFDEKAILNAKNKGLNVRQGDLFSQNFENESFDAIMINHVIEHVPYPAKLVTECKRILKIGGVMTIMTPNTMSRGHRLFKEHWRGLEVPTHLQIFSVRSLEKIARNSGFTSIKSFSSTQGILNIFDASKYMKENGSFENVDKKDLTSRILKQFRWFIFGWKHLILKGTDEVAVIICKK